MSRYRSGRRKKFQLSDLVTVIKTVACCLVIGSILFGAVYCSKYTGFYSWERLNSVGDANLTLREEEYYYTIDKYLDMRYSRAMEIVNNMNEDGLLLKKYYKYLSNGVNSDYFKNECIIDYQGYQEEADKFIKICDWLVDGQYDAEPSACDSETCIFVEYMEAYVNEEYRGKLNEAHTSYHKAIHAQESMYELTDDELKYYYQVELVSDLDNIESIEVDLTYLTCKNLLMKDKVLNWFVRSNTASILRDSKKLTLEDKEALEYLNLSVDAGLYDTVIADKVTDLLFNIGDSLENVSGDSMTVVDITGIEDYETYIEEAMAKKTNGVNIRDTQRFLCLTISDRYAGEQVYIVFDIKQCRHKSELPTFDEVCTDEWKDSLIHRLVEDSFWSDAYSEVSNSVVE